MRRNRRHCRPRLRHHSTSSSIAFIFHFDSYYPRGATLDTCTYTHRADEIFGANMPRKKVKMRNRPTALNESKCKLVFFCSAATHLPSPCCHQLFVHTFSGNKTQRFVDILLQLAFLQFTFHHTYTCVAARKRQVEIVPFLWHMYRMMFAHTAVCAECMRSRSAQCEAARIIT